MMIVLQGVLLFYALMTLAFLGLRLTVRERWSWVGFYNNLLPLAIYPAPVGLLVGWGMGWHAVTLTHAMIVLEAVRLYAPMFIKARPPRSPVAPTLRVMTYNALAEFNPPHVIADVLLTHLPDVVHLQEILADKAQAVFEQVASYYPYHVHYRDQATLSRLPFRAENLEAYWLQAPTADPIRIELKWEGRDLVLYNVHTTPPMVFQMLQGRPYDSQLRSMGVRELLDLLAQETATVMVTGDFNATDTTEDYRQIRAQGYRDAFQEAGYGMGFTFPLAGNLDPRIKEFPDVMPLFMRIDFVFYRGRGIRAQHAHTLKVGQSDHLPLVVEFTLEEALPFSS